MSELLGERKPEEIPEQMPEVDPSRQFAKMPDEPIEDTRLVVNTMPSGPGQGVSMPQKTRGIKEYFPNESETKLAILVFAIILVLSSGIFYSSVMRPYVPGSVGSDGKVTLLGSLVSALLGTVMFFVIKTLAKC